MLRSQLLPVPVVFLPGILMPVAVRYRALLGALGGDARPVLKEPEVYGGPSVPPPGYSLKAELDGIADAADAAGLEAFHLYGHSGGGACALAFSVLHPERVLSLAMDEPATDFDAEDLRRMCEANLPMLELPPDELVRAFTRLLVRSDLEPPPPPDGPPPPWMSTRPPGISAFIRALVDSTCRSIASATSAGPPTTATGA